MRHTVTTLSKCKDELNLGGVKLQPSVRTDIEVSVIKFPMLFDKTQLSGQNYYSERRHVCLDIIAVFILRAVDLELFTLAYESPE